MPRNGPEARAKRAPKHRAILNRGGVAAEKATAEGQAQ